MTSSASFLPSDFTKSDRDLQLKINKPALASAALGLMLAGCGAPANPTDAVPATESSSSEAAMTSSAATDTTAKAADSTYADGTYESTGNYRAPSGDESIDVSLTIKNGIVTDSTYRGLGEGKKTEFFQAAFGEGYKEYVVGQSIDQISLDIVNGSSLTPMGFMDALQKIKVEAAKKA